MSAAPIQAVNHHADYRGFSGVAGLLGSLLFLAMGRTNARLAVDIASVSAADHVVDIGCGPGVAVRAAAYRGARATGIDPAPVMLRVARAVTRGRDGIVWAEGAAEKLPVPSGSATVVWSLATVHHWKDVTKGLAEAHRVLAPGGRVLAIERQVAPDATGIASHGWTEQQAESFAAQCRTAGFDDLRVEGRSAGRRKAWAVHGVKRPTS
jgi:ubiquinone/menaquinone biosynthesis C-methylase UbiE